MVGNRSLARSRARGVARDQHSGKATRQHSDGVAGGAQWSPFKQGWHLSAGPCWNVHMSDEGPSPLQHGNDGPCNALESSYLRRLTPRSLGHGSNQMGRRQVGRLVVLWALNRSALHHVMYSDSLVSISRNIHRQPQLKGRHKRLQYLSRGQFTSTYPAPRTSICISLSPSHTRNLAVPQ